MHQLEPSSDPAAPTGQPQLRPGASLIVAASLVGFGAVAWWPAWPLDLPPYGLVDGVVLVALGTVAVIIPGMLATMAFLAGWGGRKSRAWLGVAVALASAAVYVAYFWGSLMVYFREPENTFLW